MLLPLVYALVRVTLVETSVLERKAMMHAVLQVNNNMTDRCRWQVALWIHSYFEEEDWIGWFAADSSMPRQGIVILLISSRGAALCVHYR